MNKRIIIMFITIILLSSSFITANAEIIRSPEPYDYSSGLLDDTRLNIKIPGNEKAYDNDLTTFSSGISGNEIIFPVPINIEQLYLKNGGKFYDAILTLTFYNGQTLTKKFNNFLDGYYDIGYNDVIKVSFAQFLPMNIYEIDFFGSYEIESEPPQDPIISNVENINFETTENSIFLTYELPKESTFSFVKILVNGEEFKTNNNNFFIEGLNSDTEYRITLISVDSSGNESPGSTIIVRTNKKELKNVTDVKVQEEYNRVHLSWKLPDQEDFHHVKIYRKTIEELIETETALQNIFSNKVYAKEKDYLYIPLFETNGTYFKDLTVKPRSEYEYKLTTVTTDGLESQGIFVTAETPDEPDPVIVGGGFTETENGDYVYTWTEPTEGQVKIIVGGEDYATVEASQGEITIPKEDMKYIFGKPDVSLVPISQYGKEGNEYNPTNPLKNIRLPFDADGLLKSGFSLLTVVGPFILLALSFILVPRLIRVIKQSIENKKVRSGIR